MSASSRRPRHRLVIPEPLHSTRSRSSKPLPHLDSLSHRSVPSQRPRQIVATVASVLWGLLQPRVVGQPRVLRTYSTVRYPSSGTVTSFKVRCQTSDSTRTSIPINNSNHQPSTLCPLFHPLRTQPLHPSGHGHGSLTPRTHRGRLHLVSMQLILLASAPADQLAVALSFEPHSAGR